MNGYESVNVPIRFIPYEFDISLGTLGKITCIIHKDTDVSCKHVQTCSRRQIYT